MSKNILTMLLGNLPKPEHSYNSTQGHILKSMLEETGIEVEVPYIEEIPEIGPEDTIYLYLGFGYSPESTDINVFGGMKNCGDFTCEHLKWLSQHKGKVIALEYEFPDYGTIVGNKISGLTDEQMERWKGLNIDNLHRMHKENNHLVFPNDGVANKCVIGDSHAYCLYRPGYVVNSVPHKTLFGALKEGFDLFLPKLANFDSVSIMFGNIDVRHHLARQENPIESAIKLAKATVDEMQAISDKHDCCVEFYELLPIENESRKLSKSGWYKGTPFYGSWQERNDIRDAFNSEVEKLTDGKAFIQYVHWTDRYLNDRNELDFQFMEKPRGVHLSGRHFPHWTRNPQTSLDDFFS